MTRKKPRVGMKVIHRRTGAKRLIAALYSDVASGVVLNASVDGFVSWNVQDLVLEGTVEYRCRTRRQRK